MAKAAISFTTNAPRSMGGRAAEEGTTVIRQGGGGSGEIEEGTPLFTLRSGTDSNIKFKRNGGAASAQVEVCMGDTITVDVYYK